MGGGGFGAFCSSCLRNEVEKYRGLSVLDAAAAVKRVRAALATMLDIANEEIKDESGRRASNAPAFCVRR